MGEGVLQYYKTKIRKEYKIAFYSTLIVALLIHLYKFTNTLLNRDSLYYYYSTQNFIGSVKWADSLNNYYSTQNIIGSGRWALSLACGISSCWNLPWVNGLLSCIYIAMTVVVIVALFKLKNPVLIILTGAFLAASPSTTETLFYLYTADGFFIAMFLAAIAVYYSKIDENRIFRLLLSGVCICVSCGIYQAYVSFALVLALCYLIDNLLLGNYEKKDYLKWVVRQVIIYSLSLAAYFVIWKVCLYFSGEVANDYEGISEVGRIDLQLILGGFVRSVRTTSFYFLQWNVMEHGFTLYSILCIIFIVVMLTGLVVAFVKSEIVKRKWAVVLFTMALLAIIPFSCIWHFTSSSVKYGYRMLQCMTLLFVLTALLFERWARPFFKNAVCLFLLLTIFNNALMANISYYYMNLTYERTYADAVEMMVKIHDLQDEYDIKNLAVVGTRFSEVQWEYSDSNTGKIAPAGKVHLFSGGLGTNLLIDSEHTVLFLQNTLGLELKSVANEKIAELSELPEVQAMRCWPSRDSMKVIDGVLVIKLSDESDSN